MSSKSKAISRRKFLAGSASTAAGVIAATAARSFAAPQGGRSVIGANERLNAAVIGIRGQGGGHVNECAERKDICLKTICDVDERLFRGRLKNIEEKQGSAVGTEYDLRRVYDDKEIDIVCIATPNHWHALATIWACQVGKDVYVEKPASHNVFEGRKMVEAARKYKRVVQHGTQIRSSGGILEAVQKLREGVIGEVYMARGLCFRWRGSIGKAPNEPIPPDVHYDLWLGPAPFRPYNKAYLPFDWRGWMDFGCGALGDMACHVMDSAFWALNLKYPTSVEASCSKAHKIENNETYPRASTVHYTFPARGNMPPLKLHWYDGGILPAKPEGFELRRKMSKSGTFIIGDKGSIVCGEYGESPRIFPESKMKKFKVPPKTIERINVSHEQNWIDACKGGKPACSNFDYSGPFTETVVMGNLAIRMPGRKLLWNGENMKVTNVDEANEFVSRPYRQGWSLSNV